MKVKNDRSSKTVDAVIRNFEIIGEQRPVFLLNTNMQKTAEHKDDPSDKKNLFEFFIEIIGWLQIVPSPFLGASIIGGNCLLFKAKFIETFYCHCYNNNRPYHRYCMGNQNLEKKGTNHFMSRIMATPELDKNNEEQSNST